MTYYNDGRPLPWPNETASTSATALAKTDTHKPTLLERWRGFQAYNRSLVKRIQSYPGLWWGMPLAYALSMVWFRKHETSLYWAKENASGTNWWFMDRMGLLFGWLGTLIISPVLLSSWAVALVVYGILKGLALVFLGKENKDV